jgi:hypothetical protein
MRSSSIVIACFARTVFGSLIAKPNFRGLFDRPLDPKRPPFDIKRAPAQSQHLPSPHQGNASTAIIGKPLNRKQCNAAGEPLWNITPVACDPALFRIAKVTVL